MWLQSPQAMSDPILSLFQATVAILSSNSQLHEQNSVVVFLARSHHPEAVSDQLKVLTSDLVGEIVNLHIIDPQGTLFRYFDQF